MPRLRLFVAAALLPALGLPSPACAQGYLGLDATLSSPYVWRGVTRANGWVAQPEGFVSGQGGRRVPCCGRVGELRARARRSVPGRARGASGAARVDRGPGGVLKGA